MIIIKLFKHLHYDDYDYLIDQDHMTTTHSYSFAIRQDLLRRPCSHQCLRNGVLRSCKTLSLTEISRPCLAPTPRCFRNYSQFAFLLDCYTLYTLRVDRSEVAAWPTPSATPHRSLVDQMVHVSCLIAMTFLYRSSFSRLNCNSRSSCASAACTALSI